MKHLSNIYDPRREDAKRMLCYSHNAMLNGQSAIDMEWQHHLDWVNQNLIGEPQATEFYTVEQLKNMGMVGIYSKE